MFQKHAKLCPNLVKAFSVSGLALLFTEEPCPLSHQKVFSTPSVD